MSYPVKMVLVEPSVIIRSGLLSVLRQLNTFQMDVLEVSEVKQLKTSLHWKKPDVLIINPAALMVFSLQQIKKEIGNPQLKCVALQSSLVDANGLKAYDEVISLYDTTEQINEKLCRLIIDPEEEKHQETLTLREKEIIVCVIKGMTNKEIADKLHLSSHTVVSHRRNIANKLKIHSTAGLTIYAIVNKLVVI
ncbi:helix-turn-helix transcriptional regulator [Bacteroidia bacterium]|nr:helix-turn-helix transcriptional regulator [Bacteroidia bacterium]